MNDFTAVICDFVLHQSNVETLAGNGLAYLSKTGSMWTCIGRYSGSNNLQESMSCTVQMHNIRSPYLRSTYASINVITIPLPSAPSCCV